MAEENRLPAGWVLDTEVGKDGTEVSFYTKLETEQKFYTKEHLFHYVAYAEKANLSNRMPGQFPISQPTPVLRHRTYPPPGRPRIKITKLRGERSLPLRCSRCGEVGHDCSTCWKIHSEGEKAVEE